MGPGLDRTGPELGHKEERMCHPGLAGLFLLDDQQASGLPTGVDYVMATDQGEPSTS